MTVDPFRVQVARLFAECRKKHLGQCCEIPVLGGSYVPGEDDEKKLKKEAVGALRAREWFENNAPADAQPLPISCRELEDRRYTHGDHPVLDFCVALYGFSLSVNEFDLATHPSFGDFVSGVLASEYSPDFVKEDDEGLGKRYRPRALPGLNEGLCWNPPKGKCAAT